MSDARWHVSSAVIQVREDAREGAVRAIGAVEGVEVHAAQASRIVITIEGSSTGELGDRLTRINLMPGVLSATMVFEHAEPTEDLP